MRLRGRIVFYHLRRKFGFILASNGEEIFFHLTSCDMVPELSQDVEFELGPSYKEGKGQQAIDVRLAGKA